MRIIHATDFPALVVHLCTCLTDLFIIACEGVSAIASFITGFTFFGFPTTIITVTPRAVVVPAHEVIHALLVAFAVAISLQAVADDPAAAAILISRSFISTLSRALRS